MGTVIRSFKAPARRSIIATVLVGIALVGAAAPASARGGKSPRSTVTAAATTSANSITLVPSEWYSDQCTFDVEYHWDRIRGRDLSASIQLVDANGTPLAWAPVVAPVSGSGWAMFFFKFYGSVGAPREIYARGSILSGGVEDSTSVATSGPLSSACGGSFGVARPTIVQM